MRYTDKDKEFGFIVTDGICHGYRNCDIKNVFISRIVFWGNAIDRLAELEDKIESGELVEVVRCKDCICVQHDTIFNQYWCSGDKVKENDFCSCGEKK